MTHTTIIFDCDGTLTDTEYLNNKANADLLASYGLTKYTTEYSSENFIGTTLEDIKRVIEAEQGVTIPSSYFADYLALVREYHTLYLKPVPGAVEAAHDLARRFKTCVGSNGERGNVIDSLKGIGLFDLFGDDKIFTKNQVAKGKPAPDLFLFAARQLESDPAACIVIEDSPPGVAAGVAAGMVVIGFTGVSHDPAATAVKLKEAGAHAIYESWADILHSINSLTSSDGAV